MSGSAFTASDTPELLKFSTPAAGQFKYMGINQSIAKSTAQTLWDKGNYSYNKADYPYIYFRTINSIAVPNIDAGDMLYVDFVFKWQ